MLSILMRLLYIVVGWIVLLPLIIYCERKGLRELPKWAYYLDNSEDGYNGLKGTFWPNYLKAKGKKQTIFTTYWWCAVRNPCWNMRHHPWASISVELKDVEIEHKGTTKHHTYKTGKHWYNTIINGKYKSYFRLIPLSPTKSLYLRFGWKVYPHYYYSNIKELPEFKKRSVWAVSIRIRSKGY